MNPRLATTSPALLPVGVDIGGSKVLAVALDVDREVLAEVRLPNQQRCGRCRGVGRPGGGVTDVGRPFVEAVIAALHRQAQSSPFLAAFEVPTRVTVLLAGSHVAAIGAALSGVFAPELSIASRLR